MFTSQVLYPGKNMVNKFNWNTKILRHVIPGAQPALHLGGGQF